MTHDPAVRTPLKRRVITGVLAVVAVVVLFLIGAAVIPRWWPQRVGDVVGGRLTVGALFGLFIGFVFTLVPLLVLQMVIRFRSQGRTWRGWIGWLALVLITAAPNLMTLGIIWGRGKAAHAGERIFDDEGPGFRLWSMIGVIAGIVAMVGLMYLVRTRGWFRDQNRRMRNELSDRSVTQTH